MEKWKTLDKEKVLDAHCFSYFRHTNRSPISGKERKFDVLKCPDWVNVIVKTKENNFVMIKQFRHGADAVTLEVPAGCVEEGEDIIEAGKREVLEETGYEAENWQIIGKQSPNPAFISNYCYTVYADNAVKTSEQNLDEFEEIDVLLMNENQIVEAIKNGDLNHSLIVAAFMYCKLL